MASPDARYDVLIVGGGQAGGNLALALRRRGYRGSICLVGDEPHPPYERPPLSKGLLLATATPESTYLASSFAFAEQGIELLPARFVMSLDSDKRMVTLGDGARLSGSSLVLATGARPRSLYAPGTTLGSVFYLRSIGDSLSLRQALKPGLRLVLVGGGTIGLEVASAAVQQGLQVTVVEVAGRLLPRLLPPELSAWLAGEYGKAGVKLLLGRSVRRLRGRQQVEQVQLSDRSSLDADLVVCGIGSVANSELAEQAGIAVDNGILVDEHCRTSAPGIYAIGDVAAALAPQVGQPTRLESWQNALLQSERVADLLCGRDPGPPPPCWFWTDQLGHNIQILGAVAAAADPLFRGSPESGRFSALYHREGRLVGAVVVNQGREVRPLRELLQRGLEIPLELLADPATRLDRLLKPPAAAPRAVALEGGHAL